MRNTSRPASDHRSKRGVRVLHSLALLTLFAALGAGNLPAAESPRTHTVVIESMTFVPATIRIAPGDRVTFQNKDLVPHTATSTGADPFDSGMIKPGSSWSVIPPAGETIRYVCSYHPAMKGEIVIVDPATTKSR